MSDRPVTPLPDLTILRITGALFTQDARIMHMPIPLAMSLIKHGLVRSGKDSRQLVGVTKGDGSDPQAHVAKD